MRSATVWSATAAALISNGFVGIVNAQERDASPVIRLSTSHGGYVASNYIEPAVVLSEDSYIFVVAVDVDRQIRVLHPEFPGLSIEMSAGRELMLPRFFAGFGENRGRASDYAYASSLFDSFTPGLMDTRGTVIALASRRPFDLASITRDGDWDYRALRLLVDAKDPYAAAGALARQLGAPSEPIGRDVLRFAGQPRYYASGYSDYYGCSNRLGGLGFLGGIAGYPLGMMEIARLRQAGYTIAFYGIDACGQPQFAVYPNAFTPPPSRRPAVGGFPRSRLPGRALPRPGAPPALSDRTPGTPFPTREPQAATPPDRMRVPVGTQSRRPPSDPTRVASPERSAPAPTPARVPERLAPPPRTNNPERTAAPPPPVVRQAPEPAAPREPAQPAPARAPDRVQPPPQGSAPRVAPTRITTEASRESR